jgi:hypothetical protein
MRFFWPWNFRVWHILLRKLDYVADMNEVQSIGYSEYPVITTLPYKQRK